MKKLGKILLAILGVFAPILLVLMVLYLAVPPFKTFVDENVFNKPPQQIEQEKEPEVDAGTEDENEPSTDTGSENEETETGEGEQIPETPATVFFAKNTIYIEV